MGIPSLLPYSFSTILMSWKTKTQNENQKKKKRAAQQPSSSGPTSESTPHALIERNNTDGCPLAQYNGQWSRGVGTA
jgi:hypothetical protein